MYLGVGLSSLSVLLDEASGWRAAIRYIGLICLCFAFSLFLLVASNVYAAPPNYTVVGVDKFNGADGAGNSISQNATALGNSFNAIINSIIVQVIDIIVRIH
jgi:hypothetical protein